jgi:hypothetical protein
VNREARQKFRCSKRKLKFNRTVPQLEQTKYLEKKYKKVMDRCIRYSFAIKSSPEALLFFKFLIADFISSMVIGALMILFKSSVS